MTAIRQCLQEFVQVQRRGLAFSTPGRLRIKRPVTPFSVVLVEPEIPQNAGNVGRTCLATGSRLHLIEKLGFKLDAKAAARAGLDYWKEVDVTVHKDWHAFREQNPGLRLHLFASVGARSYLEADFKEGDALVFGKESVGLPRSLIDAFPDRVVSIPTVPSSVRSLNLSNAVSIALYEALRQTGALAETQREE